MVAISGVADTMVLAVRCDFYSLRESGEIRRTRRQGGQKEGWLNGDSKKRQRRGECSAIAK
jgi:hypothetical protein